MRFSREGRLFLLVKLCHKSQVAGRVRLTWVRQTFREQFHKPAPAPPQRSMIEEETGSVLDELKAAIAIEINKITAETCRRAIMDIFPRLDQVLESNRDHFEHLL